jgi:hypothetical protein
MVTLLEVLLADIGSGELLSVQLASSSVVTAARALAVIADGGMLNQFPSWTGRQSLVAALVE